MKLYCLRHGRTNYNDLGLCNGDPSKPVYLTAEGVKQAEQAAEALRDKPLERIFVSQLPRTQQTAEIVNRCHQAPLDVIPALNDIRSGCEGRSVADYQSAIAHDPLHAKVGDGESLFEYKQRVMGFLASLEERSESEVALVAHEETLRVIYGWMKGLDDHSLPKLRFENCEILECQS